MRSEEDLIRELNEIRADDEILDKEGEAMCLIANFLDQIGKKQLAKALRMVSEPTSQARTRSALSLVK